MCKLIAAAAFSRLVPCHHVYSFGICFILSSYSFPVYFFEKNKPQKKKIKHGPRPRGNYTVLVETLPQILFVRLSPCLERQDYNQGLLQDDVLLITEKKSISPFFLITT